MALARDLEGGDNRVIAVIGDGAITGGMAWEAMNHAGSLDSRLIVILNDNGMSIAPAVGALNDHFTELRQGRMPSVFAALGFHHLGPVDGHDLKSLLTVLKTARDREDAGPILIHVVTEKGRGHPFPGPDKERYHAVPAFDPVTFAFKQAKANAPTYTQVFASSLIAAAERDPKVVAITAAMPSGTGLDIFAERFPDRTFDVGIAEQHAVTLAAGLATEGVKPFCTIYSTFLQRGFDQVVHDVALQGLPVRFAIDRAGLVGQDGATHAGSFDLGYMAMLPGMVVMAPADAVELRRMVATAAAHDDGPIAFRYPRGEAAGSDQPLENRPLAIGRGRLLREGSDVAILSLGGRLAAALDTAQELAARGIEATVADARFCKPLDAELVEGLARNHPLVVTVEDGAIGGFATHVLQHLAHKDLLARTRFRAFTLPDRFVGHGSPAEQYAEAGLDAAALTSGILAALLR